MKLFGLTITRSATTKSTPSQKKRSRGHGHTTRSFLSAAADTIRESTWTTQPRRIDAFIVKEWTKIVARCQHEAEEGDHARKFIQMMRENIVGHSGVTLQPQITDPDGKPDKRAGDAILDAFSVWSKKGNCEITGSLSRSDYERLAISAIAHTGEFIVQKCYGANVSPWGFAVRFLDPHRLDPTHCEDRGATFIKHGIEFTKLGKPVAYWFRKENVKDVFGTGVFMGDYDVIPAHEIIHGFIPEIIGQKRGLPAMRTAVGRLRMFAGFEDAVFTNARVTAAKMGFFKKTPGATDDEGYCGSDGDGTGGVDDIRDAEAGAFEDIGDRDFVAWSPQFPDASIEQFSRSMLRSIASGLNVSYNNLASDLTSVNFSSIRQGAMDEREVWKGFQKWFIEALCEPVFFAWLEYSILAGKVLVNGKPLKPERLEKYKSVTFIGRRWAWIDPASEIAAAEKSVALKTKSRSQIIRDQGDDPWNVWNEISDEEKDMEALGLDPVVKIAGDTSGTNSNDDEPAGDDEKDDADDDGENESSQSAEATPSKKNTKSVETKSESSSTDSDDGNSGDEILAVQIGVGGTTALIAILTNPDMSAQQKKDTIKILFGLPDSDVDKLVGTGQATQQSDDE